MKEFIFRYEIGDAYLGAVSRLISNVFESGDALLLQDGPEGAPAEVGPNQPYINLATVRMVVLADEILESFFETDLAGSFRLESVPGIELPEAAPDLLGGLWSAVATADNRRMFNRLTDELGKTIGRHAVVHQPAIGRYTGTDEPKARESLLTFAMRHSASRGNLAGAASASSASSASSATVVAPAPPKAAPAEKPAPTPTSPEMPLLHAASAALMERATFAIDDVGDEDEEALSDGELGGSDDDVMDEVGAFLEAHDSGLSEADLKALAKDLQTAKPMK